MSDKLTIADIRSCSICLSGVRRYAAVKGLDFRQLVKEGWPLEEMRKIEDRHMQMCVAAADKRVANG